MSLKTNIEIIVKPDPKNKKYKVKEMSAAQRMEPYLKMQMQLLKLKCSINRSKVIGFKITACHCL